MSKLLFVCGFPSGGTELTKTVLNAHPDIHIANEMPWLKDISNYGYTAKTILRDMSHVQRFRDLLQRLDLWGSLENLSHNFASELETRGPLTVEEVLQICFSRKTARVWGSKTPQYTEHLEVLHEVFPTACFLIVIRDVRDVCVSWKKKWGKNVLWCASKWASRMAKGKRVAEQLLEGRCCFIKYEELLRNTEHVCRKICKFLEVPFSPNMLEPEKWTDKILEGKANYGQPIKRDNFGKWKTQLDRRTVQRIEEIALYTMTIFDYTPAYASRHRPIRRVEKLAGLIQDTYAMLFIGNRYNPKNGFWDRLREVRNQLYWRLVRLRPRTSRN